MSAWGFTDRAAFEDGVAALKSATAPDHRLKRLPKLLSPPIALPKTNDSELPANVEFQLAQDFAFLAAWENLPGCVAAATVTQNDEAVGVRVAMAANEGIERPVKNSFRQILENMQKCASCHLSKEKCTNDLLDIVVKLHRNRILERLGSFKTERYRPSRWPINHNILKPVLPRLQAWIQDLQRRRNRAHQTEDITKLLEQTQALHNAISRAEGSSRDTEHEALISVIRVAFVMTTNPNGLSLQARFQLIGFDSKFTERKEFREIYAVANYGRICQSMAKAARKYSRLFQSLVLIAPKAPKVEVWQGRKHFVHAEIQLLVLHEIDSGPYSPRFIGTSKRACLLCYFLVRAHGVYKTSDTHGEVMPQWTLPSLNGLDARSRARVGNSMKTAASDVKAALVIAKKLQKEEAPTLSAFGAHSLLNVYFAPIQTPSAATIATAQDIDPPVAHSEVEPPLNSSFADTDHADPPQRPESNKSTPLLTPADSVVTSDEHSYVDQFELSASNNHKVELDGVSMSFSFEDLLGIKQNSNTTLTSAKPTYESASCSIRPFRTGDRSLPILDVIQMSYLEDTTLRREDGEKVLRFGLKGKSGQVFIATIQWIASSIAVF